MMVCSVYAARWRRWLSLSFHCQFENGITPKAMRHKKCELNSPCMHDVCEQNVDNNGILHTRLRHDLIWRERMGWQLKQAPPISPFSISLDMDAKKQCELVKVTYQLSS